MEVENLKSIEKQKLTKRLTITFAIVALAFLLNLLNFNSSESFLTINYIIGFAVWGWLVFDYKILQIDKLYFTAIGLGVIIFLYGYFLSNKFINNHKSELVQMGTTMPIFFLTIQRPIRFAFKKIMKREPIVDRPAPSFADFIYIFILWTSSMLVAVFYHEK